MARTLGGSMSIFSKINKLSLIVSTPHILTAEVKYLFILSHMRSRSSLLAHILGSNPEICGYSELKKSYSNRFDFIKMRVNLYHDLKNNFQGKYLLDKILHNSYSLSENILSNVNFKIIFLLREPEDTIKSIIHMGTFTEEKWYKNPHTVLKYYQMRLSGLCDYAQQLNRKFFIINSDDLIENKNFLLAELTSWLNLNHPLKEEYNLFRDTGKAGTGDPSQNIKAGVIKKTKPYDHITVPEDIIKKGLFIFNDCKRKLSIANQLHFKQ